MYVDAKSIERNEADEPFSPRGSGVIGRIRDHRFFLDLRTIFDAEDLVPKFD
jgi:hypothetical protein